MGVSAWGGARSRCLRTNQRQSSAEIAWVATSTPIRNVTPPPVSSTPMLAVMISVLMTASTPMTSSMRSLALKSVCDAEVTA